MKQADLQTPTPPRLINMAQLMDRLGGRSRTSIYRDVEAGRIPQPVRLGGRVYWREAEIDNAVEALIPAAA